MDFLPVNDSYNQRLQYTQSYVLPDGGLPVHGFELQNQSIIHNNIQDNAIAKQQQTNISGISIKPDRHQQKARSDIDDYIKRKSSKIVASPVSSNVNRSSTSLVYLENQPNNNSKPLILQSKVESIQISQSGSFKKIPPQVAETGDHMGLPVIKSSDLERLNSSNGIQPLVALEQSRRQSAVLPLHRKLQQSSVNINLESQVRNNKQQVSSIQINDFLSQFLKEKESVSLKRSLQQTNNIANNQKPQIQSYYNAVPLQRSLLFDKHAQPIQVNFEQTEEYLHQSQRSNLKRNIDHPVSDQAIRVDLEPSQEFRLNQSSKNSMKRRLEAIPNQKIFNIEVEQPIAVNLSHSQQQSLSNSLKNSLKRNLQAHVAQKPIEIELYPLEEERKTMVNPHMVRFFGHTYQEQRRPQPFIEPKPIHIDLEPSQENIESQTQTLTKRNLKAGTVPSLQGLKEKVEKVICEGWNPASHIFKLFKLPSTTKHTGQISFKKSRINTASLLH